MNEQIYRDASAPDVADPYLLSRQIAARTLRLYAATFGSLQALDDWEAEPACPVTSAEVSGLPLDRLARLNARAIAQLAAEDSRISGREPLRPEDWRVIRYGLTSARTLRQALAHCVDCFSAVDGRCGTMRTHVQGELVEVELDPARPERSLRGCLIDLAGVAQVHALLAWLIARPLTLVRVRLNHDPETFASLGLPPLPFEIEIGARRTSFFFAAAYLDHPVVRTADDLEDGGINNFLFALGAVGERSRGSTGDAVRKFALRSLRNAGTMPPFTEIATSLGWSPATLRRKLSDEGTGYRVIRDSCRRELGLELLQRTEKSIEDISVQLDFCDSDAFRRAFRSWMDVSPSQYRLDFRAAARG